jgi:hypothetical protein
MKAIKLYLSVFFLLCAVCVAKAMSVAPVYDEVYRNAMEKQLAAVDSARTSAQLVAASSAFERIALKYTAQWQPVYYVAYTSAEAVLRNPKDPTNESKLAKAKEWLDKLEKFADADKSEVATLKGYYFMALITTNQAAYGQKYFSEVMTDYKTAIALNSENPRPVLMLAVFEQNLPEFLRSKNDFCETMKAVGVLFGKEQKSIDKPYWGKGFYQMVSQKCSGK